MFLLPLYFFRLAVGLVSLGGVDSISGEIMADSISRHYQTKSYIEPDPNHMHGHSRECR